MSIMDGLVSSNDLLTTINAIGIRFQWTVETPSVKGCKSFGSYKRIVAVTIMKAWNISYRLLF